MKKIENHCCNCATPAYPCIGESCPNRNVEVHYCDNPKCGAELPNNEIYEVDDEEFCEDCLKEKFLRKICF